MEKGQLPAYPRTGKWSVQTTKVTRRRMANRQVLCPTVASHIQREAIASKFVSISRDHHPLRKQIPDQLPRFPVCTSLQGSKHILLHFFGFSFLGKQEYPALLEIHNFFFNASSFSENFRPTRRQYWSL